jgi:hypothetical protein
MNRKLTVLSILSASVLLGLVYDTQAPTTIASSPSVVAASPQVGLVLNIDPTTGAIVENAVPGATKLALPADLASRLSTSDAGLVEKPNPSGGKGQYVNLQGRYQNAMVGTVDANGKLVAPCAQGLNTAADKSASRK